jgi:type VI protein secretion system component VasF
MKYKIRDLYSAPARSVAPKARKKQVLYVKRGDTFVPVTRHKKPKANRARQLKQIAYKVFTSLAWTCVVIVVLYFMLAK